MFSEIVKTSLSVDSPMWGCKGRDESQCSHAPVRSATHPARMEIVNLQKEKKFVAPGPFGRNQQDNLCIIC